MYATLWSSSVVKNWSVISRLLIRMMSSFKVKSTADKSIE
jgi:hypothetical protein